MGKISYSLSVPLSFMVLATPSQLTHRDKSSSGQKGNLLKGSDLRLIVGTQTFWPLTSPLGSLGYGPCQAGIDGLTQFSVFVL